MISTVLMNVVLALAIALAPVQEPAGVDAAVPGEADSAAVSGPAVVGAPQLQTTGGGLPPRAVAPRTMEAHWPVFVVFALSWVGIVAYLIVTGRRVGRLAERLRETEVRR